jgi:hypothetical protein
MRRLPVARPAVAIPRPAQWALAQSDRPLACHGVSLNILVSMSASVAYGSSATHSSSQYPTGMARRIACRNAAQKAHVVFDLVVLWEGNSLANFRSTSASPAGSSGPFRTLHSHLILLLFQDDNHEAIAASPSVADRRRCLPHRVRSTAKHTSFRESCPDSLPGPSCTPLERSGNPHELGRENISYAPSRCRA